MIDCGTCGKSHRRAEAAERCRARTVRAEKRKEIAARRKRVAEWDAKAKSLAPDWMRKGPPKKVRESPEYQIIAMRRSAELEMLDNQQQIPEVG